MVQEALLANQAMARADGEHSESVGAGPCGRKHWYEGREVDIVSKYGGRMIGFDVTENPLLVAQAFVAKHNLNPQSTDNTALVTKIADSVRELSVQAIAKKAARNGGAGGGEALDLDSLIEGGARANPFADAAEDIPTIIRPHGQPGGITAVYNHNTKQVDVFHYQNDVDAEAIKKREEEAKKRAVAQRQKDEARRVKEAEAEEVRKRLLAQRAERTTAAPVVYGMQPKNPAAPAGGMATLSQLPQAPKNGAVGSAAGGAAGGGAVSGTKRKTSGKEVLRPKSEWDNGYAVSRFRKVGAVQFTREMDEQGFTDDEKELVLFKMPTLLQLMKGDPAEDAEGTSVAEQPRFAGQGHSMLSTEGGNNNHAYPDTEGLGGGEGGGGGAGGTEEEELDVAEVVVDAGQPVTQLKIALPVGQPLTAQFNLTHTVADIRRYVNRNTNVRGAYHLTTRGHPSRRLDEPGQTIAEARLQQSCIQLVLL